MIKMYNEHTWVRVDTFSIKKQIEKPTGIKFAMTVRVIYAFEIAVQPQQYSDGNIEYRTKPGCSHLQNYDFDFGFLKEDH